MPGETGAVTARCIRTTAAPAIGGISATAESKGAGEKGVCWCACSAGQMIATLIGPYSEHLP